MDLLLPPLEFGELVHVANDWIKGSVDWEVPFWNVLDAVGYAGV